MGKLGKLGKQAGSRSRQAPYAWLVATILLLAAPLSAVSAVAEDTDETNTALAIGATVLIAYGVVAALVLALRAWVEGSWHRFAGA